MLIPYPKDVSIRRLPVVLISLITINTLLLGVTYFAGPSQKVFETWGYIPAQAHWATAFTSMFLHDGVMHLLGNMWFLWLFGGLVEDCIGSVPFLLCYLLCGFGATGLEHLLTTNPNIPCIGASGAISGVAGMFFVLFPKQEFELSLYLRFWEVKSWDVKTHGAVGAWAVEQLLMGFMTSAIGFTAIAYWAHVGGFLTGLLLGVTVRVTAPRRVIRTNLESRSSLHTKYSTKEPADSEITQLKL